MQNIQSPNPNPGAAIKLDSPKPVQNTTFLNQAEPSIVSASAFASASVALDQSPRAISNSRRAVRRPQSQLRPQRQQIMPVSPNIRNHPSSSSSQGSLDSIYRPGSILNRESIRGRKQKSFRGDSVRGSSRGRGRGRGRGKTLSLNRAAIEPRMVNQEDLLPSVNQVPQPSLLSVAELTKLRSQFEPRVKAIAQRPRILHIQPNPRRSFTEEQLWTVVWHRYRRLDNFERGPINSYAEIADMMHIREGTVRSILVRFVRNNYQIHMARKHNGGAPTKITEELTRYLLQDNTLDKWAGYSLKQRVGAIRDQFGVEMHLTTLLNFYRRHDIKLRVATYRYQHVKSLKWQEYRKRFVIQLAQLILQKVPLCYMDETSMNSWTRPTSTYMSKKHSVNITISSTRFSGITVFGCIGNCMPGNFIYQLSASTNQVTARQFFEAIRKKATLPQDEVIYLVMDNHGAHRTQLTKELLQKLRIEPVFMSSNSPEFNSIETLWAGVKKRFHDALNKFVKVHKLTQNQFKQFIIESLVIPPEQAKAAMGYNRKAMMDFFDNLISQQEQAQEGQGQGQGQGQDRQVHQPAQINQIVAAQPLGDQDLAQMTAEQFAQQLANRIEPLDLPVEANSQV